MKASSPAVLVLEDGRFFQGTSFGAQGETSGEVCFNTGLSGYQEILTDPSYRCQIVTLTSPHIGNYGVNPEDVESDRIQVAGFIIKEETPVPSNWRATQALGSYLREQEIVGLQGIDTRALTRHIRSRGAMNGIISSRDLNLDSLKTKLARVPPMSGQDLAREVTCSEPFHWENGAVHTGLSKKIPRQSFTLQVAAVDYGIKWNILRLLEERGCRVTVFPAGVGPEEILEIKPDGIFLSNGPGDPAAVTYGIETVRGLAGKKPIFGICLGHQILALALGAKTFKLKFGHRGLNHPVKNLASGKVEITSQNHGFAVDLDSLPAALEATHINLNDNTLEGFRSQEHPAFAVQYHPESSPGPHDSRYLLDEFIDLMKAEKSEP